MKPFLYVFLILYSIFFISCKKKYSISDPNSIYIPPREDPYKPEKNLPKEMRISGKYTFTKNNKNFQFNSEDQDWYCYKIRNRINPPDEDIVPLRFRLYDKNNKLLRESLPVTSGRRFIEEFNKRIEKYPNEVKEENNRFWTFTYIPYHKEGIRIKAILVDDTGKDLKVLAEFRKRFFHKGCYRQVGFGIE